MHLILHNLCFVNEQVEKSESVLLKKHSAVLSCPICGQTLKTSNVRVSSVYIVLLLFNRLYRRCLNSVIGYFHLCFYVIKAVQNIFFLKSVRNFQVFYVLAWIILKFCFSAISSLLVYTLLLDIMIFCCCIHMQSRRAHLKKCAAKYNVAVPQLMDIIKRQEEEQQSNSASGSDR